MNFEHDIPHCLIYNNIRMDKDCVMAIENGVIATIL